MPAIRNLSSILFSILYMTGSKSSCYFFAMTMRFPAFVRALASTRNSTQLAATQNTIPEPDGFHARSNRLGILFLLLVSVLAVSCGRQSKLETARRAAEKGDAKALYFLAQSYSRGEGVPRDDVQAAQLMRKAAENGYAMAQNDLGAFYAKGIGVKQDFAQAAIWYERAAKNGDSLAQYSLGRACLLGRGVATNTEAALHWLTTAASADQVEALTLLGDLYLNGWFGVKRDPKQAFTWFDTAARKGDAGALNSLGELYQRGKGTNKDPGKALECFHLAA